MGVPSLGQEDSQEKGVATHSLYLLGNPKGGKSAGLQSTVWQRHLKGPKCVCASSSLDASPRPTSDPVSSPSPFLQRSTRCLESRGRAYGVVQVSPVAQSCPRGGGESLPSRQDRSRLSPPSSRTGVCLSVSLQLPPESMCGLLLPPWCRELQS